MVDSNCGSRFSSERCNCRLRRMRDALRSRRAERHRWWPRHGDGWSGDGWDEHRRFARRRHARRSDATGWFDGDHRCGPPVVRARWHSMQRYGTVLRERCLRELWQVRAPGNVRVPDGRHVTQFSLSFGSLGAGGGADDGGPSSFFACDIGRGGFASTSGTDGSGGGGG